MSGRTIIPISAHPQIGKIGEAEYFRLYSTRSPIRTGSGPSTASGSTGSNRSPRCGTPRSRAMCTLRGTRMAR